MQNPFFSVVIPVYNRSERIMPALLSVRNQTFADWECIVVDDGSKDGPALEQVIASLGDDRFRYIRQDNAGASKARNTGFDAASGRFIALLDSDDQFLPHKLATQAALLEQGGENLVLFSQLIVDRGVEKKWVKPPVGPRPGERIDEYVMCTSGWIQSSTIAMSTPFARKIRFTDGLPSSQDTDFAVRCASGGGEFKFIAEPLILFDDIFDPSRVSKQKKFQPLMAWINSMRHVHVSERAYWAYRGWQCARVASYSNRPLGLWLFLQSAVRGVYRPKQALNIAAQIIVPATHYQALIDWVVRTFGRSETAKGV